MLVNRSSSMRLNPHSEHANLSIFELYSVMLRIQLDRIETARDRLSSAGFLQFDLHDVETIITDDLRRVHPVRRTPLHLTRPPIEHLRLSPVLILETLPPRPQVNHDPVHLVLMELSFHV